ncbi:MAG: sigma-70 family RNA polymerase sigma factor [Firmicutes bacterium]|nr:sigma-70 family RNA polymerase sigma factor [Bacillota bacterium]
MKLTKHEEKRIRKLLQTDPERGLELVIDLFGPSVKWIAKTILGADSHRDIEECISETFIRLWRSADGFDSERQGTTLYSYTCGIARHVAIDMVRRRPKASVSMEAIALTGDDAAAMFPELREESDFAEQLADQENREAVLRAVDRMDPPDREIFLLRYWMDLPVKRIAEVLELTEKQVENRLYRGKKALKTQLTKGGSFDDR